MQNNRDNWDKTKSLITATNDLTFIDKAFWSLFIKSFYFYQPRLLSGASECNISVGNILPVRELTKLKIHSEAVTKSGA